jgi:uncharacterized oxidoreductase
MKMINKTVLITGGGSGIGLAIAKELIEKNNRVIIIGRTESKLKEASEKIGGVKYVVGDINNPEDSAKLKEYLQDEFGGLDVLINNAGAAAVYTLGIDVDASTKARDEFETNFFSAVRLIDELLPLIAKSDEGIIINVTSIVALVPGSALPTYSASKAALHSYTESLRHVLSKNTSIKVFELMPPLVNTEFSSTIGGENGIPPKDVADSLLAAIESDTYEIHTGNTAGIHQMSRAATYNDAFKMVNK